MASALSAVASHESSQNVMLAVDTILVARDSSAASRRALRAGLFFAARMQAGLHILHVFQDQKGVYPTQDLDSVQTELVQSGLVSDQTLKSVSVFAAERQKTAAGPTILRYAEEENVDLVALGTHGRSGMKRVLIGSVAETVIRRADRAVLTVRGREAEEKTALKGIDRILVPVDFSEHALESTRVAMEWAEFYHAQVDLLHVTDDNRRQSGGETSPVGSKEPADQDKASSDLSSSSMVRSKLIEFAKDCSRFDVPVNLHVEGGDAGNAIIEFANGRETDFVVMSTRGRTALERFVLGSVTETVVRHATCPVLTVRTTGQSIRATALE